MLSKLSDLFFFCSQESKFSTVKEIFFDQQIFPGKEFFLGQGNFPQSRHFSTVKEVFRGYHYYTTSFNKAWTQVLRRFKSCRRRVRDSRRWGSLTMVPAENKAKRLSSVNHTARTIHHHHHHHHQGSLKDKILDPFNTKSDAKIILNFFFFIWVFFHCANRDKSMKLCTHGQYWLLIKFFKGDTSLRSRDCWRLQFFANFFLLWNLKYYISLKRKFYTDQLFCLDQLLRMYSVRIIRFQNHEVDVINSWQNSFFHET